MDKEQPKLPAEEPEDILDDEPSPPPPGPLTDVEEFKKMIQD